LSEDTTRTHRDGKCEQQLLISIPSRWLPDHPHGLSVSMMLNGKHYDEPTIYRAAFAFEQSGDWTRMSDRPAPPWRGGG
jgi:Asp-tRNA(Asn)/Glu-tRNA(Gln) amidotransferase A subunit family amidase